MTQSSIELISYRPCPRNKKFTLADETFITVVEKGDSMIN